MSVTETARTPAHTRAEADRFRATMRHHPAGVVVITASVGGTPVGLTATSFTSVSLDPPLISFYVADASTTWPTLRRAGEFGVHLLGEGQEDVAVRFASKGVDRFAHPTSWRPGPDGVPLLDGAVAHLVCTRFDTRLIGDHWLVVGEVTHTLVLADPRPPLLYHRGGFATVAPSE
ncbi:flavin reductase family protein [Nocardiopsis sp. SBT366]|uniref:flavin reductase family protein n=1 Tax=Nocardiopsis sp. SBT366 TaxID=1580529 RepID=UPI00066C34B9|nr:flavin reductase family protein [Nocardiopsis sp. SBT366]